jgi:hypothetical protein
VTVELEAVGDLPAACKVSHALPELFDVLERGDFIVEVVSRLVRRHAGVIRSVIKDLTSAVEFE